MLILFFDNLGVIVATAESVLKKESNNPSKWVSFNN